MTDKPSKIRVTGPEDAKNVTVGRVYPVKRWHGGNPVIFADDGDGWECVNPSRSRFYPSWEPADDAPPAATPTEPIKAAREAFTVAALALYKVWRSNGTWGGVVDEATFVKVRHAYDVLLAVERDAKESR